MKRAREDGQEGHRLAACPVCSRHPAFASGRGFPPGAFNTASRSEPERLSPRPLIRRTKCNYSPARTSPCD